MADLQKWNNIADPNLIKVGQVLIVSPPVEALYSLPDEVIKLTEPYTSGEKVYQVQNALAALYFYPEKELSITALTVSTVRKRQMPWPASICKRTDV